MDELFVGIDVSKAWLDCDTSPLAQTARYGNDTAGITALVARLLTRKPALVVLEATPSSPGSSPA